MNQSNRVNQFVEVLENNTIYKCDVALRRIVEILKLSKTEKEVKNQRSLIDRLATDSVEDWGTVEEILIFTKSLD